MSKIFIIGLPRTGTTSISVVFLNLGFKVAHTAFTKQSFALADVVTDCPCFSDFKQLEQLFPGSQFIYLSRDLSLWLPSMQRLLRKMSANLALKTGQFSPVLKRSFDQIFQLSHVDLLTEQHLTSCYQAHQADVFNYFADHPRFLSINISEADSYQQLCTFLALPFTDGEVFPHLNQGAQVAHWKAVKHKHKISSFSVGQDHRQFFDYSKLK